MDLQLLLDEREIHRQLCTIADAMDRRDWRALEQVLAEDATGDFGAGNTPKNRSEIIAMFVRFLANCGPTQHLLGNLRIEFSDDKQAAVSSCYVRDVHQGLGRRSHLTFSSPGEYRDQWRRTPTGWLLIQRTKINAMHIGDIKALGVE